MEVIRGKGVEIRIDAPILSDPAALAKACSEGLSRVAEAIQRDVVMVRRDVFADSPESGKIGSGKYRDKDSYYSSGMIPFWRGGLLGSFQYIGETTPFDHELTFTSSYASKIEHGGGFGMVPVEWVRDKIDGDADADIVVYSTRMHPFMEAVTEKLNDNLLNFGYLDIFSTHFLASLKG